MNIEAFLAAKLAEPITHEVVTVYDDGSEKRFGVRGPRAAQHYSIGESRKIGRDLIDRKTGATVRVVAVNIVEI